MTAWTRASARSGEWEGPRSGVQVHIWSSSSGKRPTWWTRPPYRGTGQALLVEGGDGFGPDLLAMSGADGFDGQGALYRVPQRGLYMVSSGVCLDDYLGGVARSSNRLPLSSQPRWTVVPVVTTRIIGRLVYRCPYCSWNPSGRKAHTTNRVSRFIDQYSILSFGNLLR